MIPVNSETDCRSEGGITVGLIDTIITAARCLVSRDLSEFAVVEALKDLRSDSDVLKIINGKLDISTF